MKKIIAFAALTASILASAHTYDVAMLLKIGQEELVLENVLNDEIPCIQELTTQEFGKCTLETRAIASDDESVTLELIISQDNDGEKVVCCNPEIKAILDEKSLSSNEDNDFSLTVIAHKQ